MAEMTGAQALVALLRAHGVDTIFGIPGIHTLPFYDALFCDGSIPHILARHEQGAGFMAEGFARASGSVGVVCTITGPGVTNVATPVAEAYADSVPLLVISSALPQRTVGCVTGSLHELKNQLGVMEALTGWSRAVQSVDALPAALADAFQAFEGRPRPAYLQIPLDLFEASISTPFPELVPPTAPQLDGAAIDAAARLLRGAQRPMIIAGAGVSAERAQVALMRLATVLDAPVILGGKSRDVLPSSFPLALATSGYTLPEELLALVRESDVALVVGSKFGGQRTGEGRLRLDQTTIQVDIDAAEIGRQFPVSVGVIGDAGAALEALILALSDHSPRLPNRVHAVARVRALLEAETRRRYGQVTEYLDAVRAALPADGVLVADMTTFGYAAADYFPVHQGRTFIHPSEICTIGCALPLAIGAKVAVGDRKVVALCGDGGILLNVAELATAVQEQVQLSVVVVTDGSYTAVKNAQRQRFGGRYIATDLRNPDFLALASAFGARATTATSPSSLYAALQEAHHHAGPTLIEVPLSTQS